MILDSAESLDGIALEIQQLTERLDGVDALRLQRLFDGLAVQALSLKNAKGQNVDVDDFYAWAEGQFESRSFEAMGPEKAFVLGVLWGAIGVRDAFNRAYDDEAQALGLQRAVERRREVLEAVDAHPGITHAELAKACGKTPSRLTQIVAELDGLDLLVASRNGRTKHYYLSVLGMRMVKQSM